MIRLIKLLAIAILLGCFLYIPMPFATSRPLGVQGYIGTKVHFSWGESTGRPEGYRIYWGKSAGGPYPYRLCDIPTTKLQHTSSLNKDQTYYLVCRAYNECGESGNSNEVIWPTT